MVQRVGVHAGELGRVDFAVRFVGAVDFAVRRHEVGIGRLKFLWAQFLAVGGKGVAFPAYGGS